MIKRILIISTIYLLVLASAKAQDIPLFSQKLTNSFIYNPAMAGHTFGSATLANRRSFSEVNGAAVNNFFSFHTPFGSNKFGVGANIFREKVNFVDNIYASGAFAYHINFGSYNVLSMGVSAEYNSLGFDTGNLIGDGNDPLLGMRTNNMDFSFGVNYQHRYFKVGAAANRLATSLDISNNASVLSEFYSGYAAGLIPLRGGLDMLEPTLAFRKLSTSNDMWDAGLYYTYNNIVTVGGSVRKGDIVNGAVGLMVARKIFFGFSYEFINNNLGSDVGASSEIVVRFDFDDMAFKNRERFGNNSKQYRQDSKNALNYRKKILSSAGKRKNVGPRNPSDAKNNQKRRLRNVKSPNERYNKIEKLPKSKRKKIKNKKRRKKNYRILKKSGRGKKFMKE
ncbi:PorP/SprF family type IX secretion system membrane protein [Fulvivirga lutimaris]|uniref:PorP/SprF family type IX secretion system membrane protein n=1 Tax=Fulvivirga lutimaris TaxID=1819566 RepID=UPI0012BD785D|nr:PorP/SprF family type IX secretion system membrane protein [Fulvivirga lutimaris]MTI39576.1 type IX secretion system membrane protein PorP/SprF [Fulvivirga lutimaris]